MDIQKRFDPIHICNFTCRTTDADGATPEIPDYSEFDLTTGEWLKPCAQIEPVLFTEIPDPNYMVYRTAYFHAMGSPSAQGRIADLQDTSQKLLSAMRENNAAYTKPDTLDWSGIGYIDIT